MIERAFVGAAFICCMLLHGTLSHDLSMLHAQGQMPASTSDTAKTNVHGTVDASISDTVDRSDWNEIRLTLLLGVDSLGTNNLSDAVAALGFAHLPTFISNPPMETIEFSLVVPGGWRPMFSFGYTLMAANIDEGGQSASFSSHLSSFGIGFNVYQRGSLFARVDGGLQFGLTHADLGSHDFFAVSLDSARRRKDFMALDAFNINLYASLEADYAFDSYSTRSTARNIMVGLRAGATIFGGADWRANGTRIEGGFGGAIPSWYLAIVFTDRMSFGE